MLGSLFGIARGVLIVAILVLIGGLTVLPQDSWWQESMLIPHFEDLAVWMARWLGPSTERTVNASPERRQAPPEGQTPPATAAGAPTSSRAVGEARR